MPVSFDRQLSALARVTSTSAKPEPMNNQPVSGIAASIAVVKNVDDELKMLNNCFQVTVNVQKVFDQLLANSN